MRGSSVQQSEAQSEPTVEMLDRALDGVAIVRQSDGALVYTNAALGMLLSTLSTEPQTAMAELLQSGRTEAVELAHPDLGALRLIVFPGDARRSAERAWRRDLARELGRAQRREWPVTVAAIALDAGGRPQLAAAAWSNVLRAEDSLTPHEGGAYLAVLPDCSCEHAPIVAARLGDATPAPATASIGIATWAPGESLESLVSRAVGALARAQAAGGHQTAADPAPGARSED